MNNNIEIFYNNENLFSGISPTPFISMDQEFINFNTKWNQITKMTMNGQITGKQGSVSFYELNKGLNLLINRLNNNYGSLVIKENSTNLFSGNNVIIDSIKTDENSFYGILPFSIDFEIYEDGLFTEYYGIKNPEENIGFSEENGYIVNLTHKISAVGLKTGNKNAIESAKNWVKMRTGNYNKIVPILIKTGNGSNFLLQSTKETVDRFNGSYAWEGSYIKSSFIESPQKAILNYTLDITSGIEDGVITVNLEGSFKNNFVTGSNSLRNEYLNYDFYKIANTESLKIYGTTLNTSPISQSITEEYNNNTLNFNLSYNSDLTSNVTNDYTVTIDTDTIKNISTATLSARIYAKYGYINTRWNLVKNYYYNNFKPFSIVFTEYQKEQNNQLFPNTTTETITFNEYDAEINYNASWTNKKISPHVDIIQFTSSVKYTPSVDIYTVNPSIVKVREHNIFKIGTANKSIIDITVSAVVKPNKNISIGISEVTKELNRVKNIYKVTTKNLLIDKKITQNELTNTYSINEKYIYEGSILI